MAAFVIQLAVAHGYYDVIMWFFACDFVSRHEKVSGIKNDGRDTITLYVISHLMYVEEIL
jgi:hypothetical protein